MRWKVWLRQAHRWISIAFTLGVLVNTFAAVSGDEPPAWIYSLALGPLFLLLITGLCLFVLPYLGARRSSAEINVRSRS
ncbi:hypothetical protein AB2N04_02655 [Nitratireductor sp. GISD-1A_MAKvit]|uniref:hypothetical protein n=1 Tax=Nitratireductor sp. GISD-1A_MAKvit TaxID=3234198 RepID=UPI0034657939